MNKPVALIPARGGSKRLPRKNILSFDGKPMMHWTIEAAQASGLFSKVYLTTDDDEYAAIGAQAGASILRREAQLSDDKAGLIDVIKNTMLTAEAWPEEFCLLLPNCPLRTSRDIIDFHDVFRAKSVPALLSVVSFGWTPPERALRFDENGLAFITPDAKYKKSQAYGDTMCPSGAIYWAKSGALAQADTLYIEGITPHHMSWHRAIDIDDLYDFKQALALRHAHNHGFDFEADLPALNAPI